MTVVETITLVLAAVGGTPILIGAAAWLARGLVLHRLSKDVENYKTALRVEADKEIESFKADLKRQTDLELERTKSIFGIEASEHQIRFAKLHDKAADVLIELFTNLLKTRDAVISFLSAWDAPGTDKKGKVKVVKECFDKTWTQFYENQLFIPKGVYDAVASYLDATRNAGEEFQRALVREEQGKGDDSGGHWTKAQKDAESLITPFNKIHASIQRFIGFRD